MNSCNDWTFKCNNGKCIPYWWKCDQVNDCEDMSDELGCDTDSNEHVTKPPARPTSNPGICREHQFRCFSG